MKTKSVVCLYSSYLCNEKPNYNKGMKRITILLSMLLFVSATPAGWAIGGVVCAA